MKILILLLLTVLLQTANGNADTTAKHRWASWYSIQSLKDEGAWNITKGVMANGKNFSDYGLTCATRIYPLGTWLLVTNLASDKSVIVQVTDRTSRRFGNRIDLSWYAFGKIADHKQGVVPCWVRVLE